MAVPLLTRSVVEGCGGQFFGSFGTSSATAAVVVVVVHPFCCMRRHNLTGFFVVCAILIIPCRLFATRQPCKLERGLVGLAASAQGWVIHSRQQDNSQHGQQESKRRRRQGQGACQIQQQAAGVAGRPLPCVATLFFSWLLEEYCLIFTCVAQLQPFAYMVAQHCAPVTCRMHHCLRARLLHKSELMQCGHCGRRSPRRSVLSC